MKDLGPTRDRCEVLCQACNAANPSDHEYCVRCHQRLMVISGGWDEEDLIAFEATGEEQLSFDEHLLERISILEEVVKRTTGSVRQIFGGLKRLEQKLLVNHTGITSLREVLASKGTVGREEWGERWEAQLEDQLLGLERRERFSRDRGAILALFSGRHRRRFQKLLEEAEFALAACDVERAMGALEVAFALDPGNHPLALLIGETWFNEGDAARARGFFEAVLAAKPRHYEGLVYSGVLAYELGETARATERLEAAVGWYPDAFLPHFSLGAVHASAGCLAPAVASLSRACELEALPQANYLLGCCLYQLGHTTQAIRRLEAAVATDPGFEDAFHVLGFACLDRAWNRKAHDAFRRALRLAPSRLRFEELHQLLESPGTAPAKAPVASSPATPAAHNDTARWLARARNALAGGRTRNALSCCRQALAREPENPELLVSYAMVCLELERPREIQAVVSKVLDLDTGERLRTTACTTLIEALRSEGDHREGIRVGRRLLAESTSNFTRTLANYELAWSLAELGEDLDEALACARGALDTAPDELRRLPLAALGWVHYKRREFEQAVECLSRSTELLPSPANLTRLGMALLASGERDEARDVLRQARALDVRIAPLRDRVVECLKDSTRLLQTAANKPRT